MCSINPKVTKQFGETKANSHLTHMRQILQNVRQNNSMAELWHRFDYKTHRQFATICGGVKPFSFQLGFG